MSAGIERGSANENGQTCFEGNYLTWPIAPPSSKLSCSGCGHATCAIDAPVLVNLCAAAILGRHTPDKQVADTEAFREWCEGNGLELPMIDGLRAPDVGGAGPAAP